jgi:membrane protein
VGRILRESARRFRESNATLSAAALSYFAVLSVIPFLMVGVTVLQWFDATPTASSSTQMSAEAYEVIARPIRELLPFVDDGLAFQVRAMVQSRQWTPGFGFLILAFTASLFAYGLQRSMNNIFRGPQSSPRILRARASVLLFVFSVVFLMGVTRFLWLALENFQSPWFRLSLSVVTLTAAFSLTVYWFGKRKTRVQNVLWGAACFCFLWQVAMMIFEAYIDASGGFSEIYGQLASIACLMVWIYYASFIFLFSCSLVAVLEAEER